MDQETRQQDVAALVGFVVFACGLIGVVALPLLKDGPALTDGDEPFLGVALAYLLVVLSCAAAGLRVPGLAGFASGLAVPLAIYIAISVVFDGVVFVQLEGLEVEWGGGAAMAFVLVGGATFAVAFAQAGWPGSLASANPIVAVLGAIASFIMVAGYFAPESPATYGDTLRFSANGGVGVGVLACAAALVVVPALGFVRGRWGAGLLLGFVAYIVMSLVIARADDPGGFEILLVFDRFPEFHPAAVIGFWSLAVLAIVHTVLAFAATSGASPHTPAIAGASAGGGPTRPAVWAADPFGRHGHRYFDGRQWTNRVADGGVSSRDAAAFTPPPGGADWYPDPAGQAEHRYFDGRRWTDQVSTGGVQRSEPVVVPAPDAVSAPVDHTTSSMATPPGPPPPDEVGGLTDGPPPPQPDELSLPDDAPPPPPPDDQPLIDLGAVPPQPDELEQFDGGPPPTDDAVDPPPPVDAADEAGSSEPPSPIAAASPWARAPIDDGDSFDDRTVNRDSSESPASADVGNWSVLDLDGRALDLAVPVVIGRDPADHDELPGARLVSVSDRTVSKTHAAIGIDADGPWVMDLHSKNGVAIAADPPVTVAPMTRHRLGDGDVVVVGDVTTYTVSR